MDKEYLTKLLLQVKEGSIDIDSALTSLKNYPFEELGFAKIDHHRSLRTGFPEVVFCQGKQPNHVAAIVQRLASAHKKVLATRADRDTYDAVFNVCKDAVYHETARCITIQREFTPKYKSLMLIITAGTADLPVAEEACVTAEIMGNNVERVYDVGVAGIHRLFRHKSLLDKASVIIVVAGMEGALASVVGGLVDVPVIAVPTSIGYGASFGGFAALLSMLNSCANGIGVVNIDNGFGAAFLASSIIRLIEEKSG